jgi:GMP reductase
MRIENDVKLDFNDVLIRPKRSTLTSRRSVELERTFTFMHSGRTWTGVPIAAANMDTTGTFEMARALTRHKMITALHKHYTVEELAEFFSEFNAPDYVAYSLGIRDEDFEKLGRVLDAGLGSQFHFVVLDVPNAYLERFIIKVEDLRALCPDHTLIAGNCVKRQRLHDPEHDRRGLPPIERRHRMLGRRARHQQSRHRRGPGHVGRRRRQSQ